MPTIKDVAHIAGVSTATVSYVINDSAPVSAATRRRVQQAIEQLGYRPNQRARQLQQQRTYTLGVVLPEAGSLRPNALPEGTLEPLLIACIWRAAHLGYHTLVLTQRTPPMSVDAALHGGMVDGCILFDQPVTVPSGVPHVWAMCPPRADHTVAVVCDGAAGASRAVDALIHAASQRIALVLPTDRRDAARWYSGYRRALQRYGYAFDPTLVIEPQAHTSADGAAVLDTLWADGSVDAIIAARAPVAYGIAQAAHQMGLVLGRDLALISGFDTPLVEGAHLTALQWPIAEWGAALADRLTACIDEQPVAPRTLLAPSLMVRSST